MELRVLTTIANNVAVQRPEAIAPVTSGRALDDISLADNGFLAIQSVRKKGDVGPAGAAGKWNRSRPAAFTYGIISVSAVPLNMSGGRRSAIPAVDARCGKNARLSLAQTFIRYSAAS